MWQQNKNDLGISFTCSPSTEGRLSVITLEVSAIFLFLPLFFAVNGSLSTLEKKKFLIKRCNVFDEYPVNEKLNV